MSGGKIIISIITIAIVFTGIFVYGFNIPVDYNFASVKNIVENKETSIQIVIVGDIMLDRNVRNIINKIGFDEFFSGAEHLISSADLAIGNLEGPFTTHESLTASLKNKVLQFTFDPALAPAMADLGFDILGLANNHTLNFGKSGLETTRRYIGTSGMIYYGDPLNKDEISTIITKKGVRIGLIGFHEFNYVNYEKVFDEVQRIRPDVDVLIVTPHWGEEYVEEPSEKMQKWAHQFVDFGADAVIGTHPHIVMSSEVYKGKHIYYSLGNFAFDQYFSEETMNGLALVLNIRKNDEGVAIGYTEIPVRVDREGVSVIY